MREPPFNIAMLLFGVLLGVFVIGALVAEALTALGLAVFPATTLTAFTGYLVGGNIRSLLARLLASLSGNTGSSPTAFSLPIRFVFGALLAALMGAVYAAIGVEEVRAVSGGFAAIVVVGTLASVYLFKVMFFPSK